jgi:predicted nucleotidyltransferase
VRTTRIDPVLGAVRFRPQSLLTPGEQDVLRRFCAGLKGLAQLPRAVAVFGSRAKGGAHAHSDLDVAVLTEGDADRSLVSALSALALHAQKEYWLGEYGIALRPVPVACNRPSAFLDAIRGDMEVVWTRP